MDFEEELYEYILEKSNKGDPKSSAKLIGIMISSYYYALLVNGIDEDFAKELTYDYQYYLLMGSYKKA